jgi:predicted TIM-barrel fold metal-dependent hydrolase
MPVAALQGCSLFRYAPADLCPTPDTPTPRQPLLIDVHAHVFNGTDVQIKDFFERVVLDEESGDLVKHIGGLLQVLAWRLAPDGESELELLNAVDCNTLTAGVQRLRAGAYARAVSALAMASEQVQKTQAEQRNLRNFYLSDDAKAAVAGLVRKSFEQYEEERQEQAFAAAAPGALVRTARSALEWVIQHFNYRYANVVDYLRTYEKRSGQAADLLVASFLDFDYWISQGRKTPTSIPKQIAVMRRISELSAGRVHAFLPFCPLREIVTSHNGADGDAMKWVRTNVSAGAFIGVKLYPPMGFAPYGNKEVRPDIWNKPWLPAIAKEPDFGKKLDGALGRLYKWCEDHNVPVMAHSSPLMVMSPDFKELPGSKYWQKALDEYPKLRVNFGHMGGNTDDGAPRAEGFVKLMAAAAHQPGANAYADLGYFFDVIDKHDSLKSALAALLKRHEIARERLMYGSDWLMIVQERGWARYRTEFRKLIHEVARDPKTFERNFFGTNAGRYLGLYPSPDGKPNNRSRLEDFHENRVRPKWLEKL